MRRWKSAREGEREREIRIYFLAQNALVVEEEIG